MGKFFPFIRDTSWKKLKGFQILKIWNVPNSRKVINGNNKGVQDILSWYIINVWQGRYTWSVDLYVYNVQWYLIFVLQMGLCFLFGNLISFARKELVYYLSYGRLHTIVIFKTQTHWPNFGRISVWSIEKLCSNFCILIHCLWCYFLVCKDDMNGFNKCCIYSLILLINWNACDCLGLRCWGNQVWYVIVFITMYLEFLFF